MRTIGTPQVLRSMVDESGAADTEPVRQKIAEHSLVNAAGETVDEEELATGISYKMVWDKQAKQAVDLPAFIYQVPNAKPGDPATMLAIFGAKTLATNETSQARNSKGGTSAAEQLEAVKDRFALIDTGKWVDRTRDGTGARLDKDALAGAVVEEAGKLGKTLDYQTVRQKIEEDANYVKLVRGFGEVKANYEARVGKPVKSLADALDAM